MKLILECKEITYRSVKIDTDEYDIKEDVFDIATFINNIKDDPKLYINQNLNECEEKCNSDSDIENLKIYRDKE